MLLKLFWFCSPYHEFLHIIHSRVENISRMYICITRRATTIWLRGRRGGLNPKVNFFRLKLSQLGSVQRKLVQLTRITGVGLGAPPIAAVGHKGLGGSPQAMGDFVHSQQKIVILALLGSNFIPFWRHLKKNKLLKFENQLKN